MFFKRKNIIKTPPALVVLLFLINNLAIANVKSYQKTSYGIRGAGKLAKARQVYLPKDAVWYDFWTGQKMEGGQTIAAASPMDIMPLFVKTGSIVPMGPLLEYSTEKPADKIELRIYAGADGTFRLYEDANDTYNYEKGEFANINISWDYKKRELSIAARTGSFPGMLKSRTFNVVVVSENNGLGGDETIN